MEHPRLARELGTTQTHVSQVWRKAGLLPHRLRRYMASNDPDFEAKAADVIGLYLNPPVNAAVFSVDEKSAIQALDRLDPVLPLPSPLSAELAGAMFRFISSPKCWVHFSASVQPTSCLPKPCYKSRSTRERVVRSFSASLSRLLDSFV